MARPERSHYDVLGVPRDAATDTIRRAYLREARRWHPDRPTGDPDRMRAVNEAWQVLGDARSRTSYNLELRRRQTTSSARSSTGPASRSSRSGGSPSPPPEGPSGPTPVVEMVGFQWRWISLAAVVLVAGVIALIFLATSSRDTSPAAPDSLVLVSPSLPEPGDCFVIYPQTVITVDCGQPHDGKLSAWVPLGAPCPPDTELHWVRSAQLAVCYHPLAG